MRREYHKKVPWYTQLGTQCLCDTPFLNNRTHQIATKILLYSFIRCKISFSTKLDYLGDKGLKVCSALCVDQYIYY